MTVRIDYERCNGCGKRPEACCEEVCPGNLFHRIEGKTALRDPSDCWDCFACVKACPRAALAIELPFQISEARNRLTARIGHRHIIWTLCDSSGTAISTYTIQNKTEGSP